MPVSCSVNGMDSLMLYMLPMLLGRTYDMNTNTIGIDIYDKKYIDAAIEMPSKYPSAQSDFVQIENADEKRKFLGISADLALKISSGVLNIKGSGDYIRSTSSSKKSYDVLVRTTFQTVWREIDLDADPKDYWKELDRTTVGTHVIHSILYGGEMYASINFVALKEEYYQEIAAAVKGELSKSGAFNLEAEGQLNMLVKNLSSKAKIEIEYFGTVPLEHVPTTIEGLMKLINEFESLVKRVNKGIGVPLCVKLLELSKWDTDFRFLKNGVLTDALKNFNQYFNELLEAKATVKDIIRNLPDHTPSDYTKKLIDFSERLSKTIGEFHNAIGKLDLEKGTDQLDKALTAFAKNKNMKGMDPYNRELKKIGRLDLKAYALPRGVFVEWGSKNCSYKKSNLLYSGIMVTHVDQALGGGSEYMCLPEDPDMTLPKDATSNNRRSAKVTGVRYQSMSVFYNKGKDVKDKVAACAVCETISRPTVEVFPGVLECPIGWMKEYSGFIVSSINDRIRGEFACVYQKPVAFDLERTLSEIDPVISPVMASPSEDGEVDKGATIPCFVCSK